MLLGFKATGYILIRIYIMNATNIPCTVYTYYLIMTGAENGRVVTVYIYVETSYQIPKKYFIFTLHTYIHILPGYAYLTE